MTPMSISDIHGFEIVVVNESPYMFTNLRVNRDSLPEGFVAYDVRDECDGEFVQVRPYVLVNHWGTIIGIDELPLDPKLGDYEPSEEDGWYLDCHVCGCDEFLKRYDGIRSLI